MSNLAEVVTLYESNARDIAQMLREAARNIETEDGECDRTECMVGIQFTESGAIKLYGWGTLDGYKTLAILQLALHDHANRMLP